MYIYISCVSCFFEFWYSLFIFYVQSLYVNPGCISVMTLFPVKNAFISYAVFFNFTSLTTFCSDPNCKHDIVFSSLITRVNSSWLMLECINALVFIFSMLLSLLLACKTISLG